MEVTCTCGETFMAKDRRARYCSDRCRKRAQRAGEVVELPVTPEPSGQGANEAATVRDLEAAGRLDTYLGQACVTLARRLDRPGVDTGSAVAAVAARLDDLMTKATRGAGAASAPQQYADELAKRRARHA